MHRALVGAETSPSSGFPLTNILILIVVFAVGWPLFRTLRRSVSESRKRRWVEQDLMDPMDPMDPPPVSPPSGQAPDQSRE